MVCTYNKSLKSARAKTTGWPGLSLVLLFLLLISACSPETDQVFPETVFANPAAGSVFTAGDTILVEARVSDNENLESVELSLVDSNGNPVLPSIEVYNPVNPFTLRTLYHISDVMLAGGVYELRVRAFDGFNYANAFLQVNLKELEKQLKYPVIITSPDQQQAEVWKGDNLPAWRSICKVQGDFLAAGISSPAQMVFLAGKATAGITAIDLRESRQSWHIPAEQQVSGHYFEGINFCYPLLYASLYSGTVKGYDHEGMVKYTGILPERFYPVVNTTTDAFVITAMEGKFTDEHAVMAAYRESGFVRNQSGLPEAVMGLVPVSGNRALVLKHHAGGGSIWLFDPLADLITKLHDTDDSIFGYSAMDADNLIFSGETQGYWYRFSTNSLVPMPSIPGNAFVACDPVNRVIYTGKGNRMQLFGFPGGEQVAEVPAPGEIRELLLLFNK